MSAVKFQEDGTFISILRPRVQLIIAVNILFPVIPIGKNRSKLPMLFVDHFIAPRPEVIDTDLVPGMFITKTNQRLWTAAINAVRPDIQGQMTRGYK